MEKIKFIRTFNFYADQFIDIVYKSGRVKTTTWEELPKTALKFMRMAIPKKQIDWLYNTPEVIYKL